MSRSRIKRIAGQLLVTLLVLATLGVVAVAARTNLSASTGRATTALHEEPEVPADADKQVSWLPDAWAGDRAMEPATRVEVEAAYIRAWSALGRYEATGDPVPVRSYWSGPARDEVLRVPRTEATQTWSVAHHLRLTFYSIDGATAAFDDTDADVVRGAVSAGVETLTSAPETYQVVVVLEDGYWRVRQLRRSTAAVSPTVIMVAGGRLEVTPAPAATPARPVPALRGTSYVPPQLGVSASWPSVSDLVVTADFTAMRKAGLDAVRIVLPGPSTVSVVDVAKLRQLTGLAAGAGLHVTLALFPAGGDHRPAAWADDDAYLRTIVSGMAGQPGVVLWDLADSPDTSGSGSSSEVLAWLLHEIPLLRSVDSHTPVTVSWGALDEALEAPVDGLLDAVAVDWTRPASRLAGELASLRTVSGRPVLITSVGSVRHTSPLSGWTAKREAGQVADVLSAARAAGVSSVFARAWRDTPLDAPGVGLVHTVLSRVVGDRVGSGVTAPDGTARPALALFRKDSDLARVPRPSPLLELLPSTRHGLGLAVIAVAVALLWRRRRGPRLRRTTPSGTASAEE